MACIFDSPTAVGGGCIFDNELLTSVTLPVGGGISDASVAIRQLRKRTQRNVRNLLLLSGLFISITQGTDYEPEDQGPTDEAG